MTIDRLLPMLHIIADYSESYRTTSFSYSEVKRGSHKEVSWVELYLDGCVKNPTPRRFFFIFFIFISCIHCYGTRTRMQR